MALAISKMEDNLLATYIEAGNHSFSLHGLEWWEEYIGINFFNKPAGGEGII